MTLEYLIDGQFRRGRGRAPGRVRYVEGGRPDYGLFVGNEEEGEEQGRREGGWTGGLLKTRGFQTADPYAVRLARLKKMVIVAGLR